MAAERLRTARLKTPAQLAKNYPISVVIPARNAAHDLTESLAALARNNLLEVEVILVDDASSDGTAETAASILDASVTILRLERQGGPAAARNRGLAAARYPHVLFVDADVVLPDRTIDWMREALDIYSHRNEVGGVLGVYDENIPWDDFPTQYKNLYTCFLYSSTENVTPFIHTPILCIRKDLLTEVGGFDASLATAEDFRLGILLGSRGHRFVIDRKVKGVHRKRYSFSSLLKEDARRIVDLGKVRLDSSERSFYYRALRWSRLLSVSLPIPILGFSLLGLWLPAFYPIAGLLFGLFYAVNLPLFYWFWKLRGLVFVSKALIFFFIEMLWAQLVVGRTLLSPGARLQLSGRGQ